MQKERIFLCVRSFFPNAAENPGRPSSSCGRILPQFPLPESGASAQGFLDALGPGGRALTRKEWVRCSW